MDRAKEKRRQFLEAVKDKQREREGEREAAKKRRQLLPSGDNVEASNKDEATTDSDMSVNHTTADVESKNQNCDDPPSILTAKCKLDTSEEGSSSTGSLADRPKLTRGKRSISFSSKVKVFHFSKDMDIESSSSATEVVSIA